MKYFFVAIVVFILMLFWIRSNDIQTISVQNDSVITTTPIIQEQSKYEYSDEELKQLESTIEEPRL